MRPGSAETDSTAVEARASGMANTNASAMPAVAMATVRQVSRATMARNSALTFGGKKSPMKRAVTLTLSGAKNSQALNSVAYNTGARITSGSERPEKPFVRRRIAQHRCYRGCAVHGQPARETIAAGPRVGAVSVAATRAAGQFMFELGIQFRQAFAASLRRRADRRPARRRASRRCAESAPRH